MLSFSFFIIGKFVAAPLSRAYDVLGVSEIFSASYYIMQSLSYVTIFFFVKEKINKDSFVFIFDNKVKYKSLIDAIIGVFAAELLSQTFSCGCLEWLDISLYVTLPIISYWFSVKIEKMKHGL